MYRYSPGKLQVARERKFAAAAAEGAAAAASAAREEIHAAAALAPRRSPFTPRPGGGGFGSPPQRQRQAPTPTPNAADELEWYRVSSNKKKQPGSAATPPKSSPAANPPASTTSTPGGGTQQTLAAARAEHSRRAAAAEASRRTHAAAVLEGFRDVNEALRVLESDAEALEVDLNASSATMSAIDAARHEQSMAHMQVLASQARGIRRRVEEEEAAGEAARALLEAERLEKARVVAEQGWGGAGAPSYY